MDEELFGAVTLHPFLQRFNMFRLVHVTERHLMRAKGALDWFAVDHLWPRPSFWRPQDNHRPARTFTCAFATRVFLDRFYLRNDAVECRGHELMHFGGIVAFDEVRLIAITPKKGIQFRVRDARQQRRSGDFITVEVKDGQNGPIAGRVEELVRMPARGEWTDRKSVV